MHQSSPVARGWLWMLAAALTALLLVALWPVRDNERREAGRPVGTTGEAAAPEPEDLPATLHDLETMTGALDPHELLGWHVDFHVRVKAVRDATSFWIGTGESRVLVLSMTPVGADQFVRITGTVEGRDQQVYIRADRVTELSPGSAASSPRL